MPPGHNVFQLRVFFVEKCDFRQKRHFFGKKYHFYVEVGIFQYKSSLPTCLKYKNDYISTF